MEGGVQVQGITVIARVFASCQAVHGSGGTLALVRRNVVEMFYAYADAVEQWIICMKFWEVGTSEITSAGFSGTIQQSGSHRVCRTCSATRYPWLCSLISVPPFLLLLKEKGVIGGAGSFTT